MLKPTRGIYSVARKTHSSVLELSQGAESVVGHAVDSSCGTKLSISEFIHEHVYNGFAWEESGR